MKVRGKPEGMTWREHLYGQAAASLMVRAGRLAQQRGDIHELRHCAAALGAGNTGGNSHEDVCLADLVLNRYPRKSAPTAARTPEAG